MNFLVHELTNPGNNDQQVYILFNKYLLYDLTL